MIYIKDDFLDKELVGKIIKKNKVDIVFHLGAITQVLDSIKDPYKTHQINILGTINFLENIFLTIGSKSLSSKDLKLGSKDA